MSVLEIYDLFLKTHCYCAHYMIFLEGTISFFQANTERISIMTELELFNTIMDYFHSLDMETEPYEFKPIEKPKKHRAFITEAKNNIDYGEQLSEWLIELGISQKELAKAIGVDERTVSRYICGTNSRPLSQEIKDKIEQVLNDGYYYKEYEHMPAKEFSNYFSELWKFFKKTISQEEFAQRVGHGNQSIISRIADKEYKIYSVKKQYDYLYAFYELCKRNAPSYYTERPSELSVYSDCAETAEKLYKILFPETSQQEPFYSDTPEGDLPGTVVDTIIDYLISLPYKAQNMILTSPLAFFDSMIIPHFSSVSYRSAKSFIERFRRLSDEEQRGFYKNIKELASEEDIFCYYDDEKTWQIFEMESHYRKMIYNSRKNNIADPDSASVYKQTDKIHGYDIALLRSDKDDSIDENVQRHKFEAVLGCFYEYCWKNQEFNAITDCIIDDIEYRLKMSPFEWHLWLIYARYVYDHSDTRIDYLFRKPVIEQGLSEIADFILSLPFKDQKNICAKPSYFFDSMSFCRIRSDENDCYIDYLNAADVIHEYDQMTYDEKIQYKKKAKDDLEDSVSYLADHYYFSAIGACYSDTDEIPIYIDLNKQRKAITDYLFRFDIYETDSPEAYKRLADIVARDISFKLTMNILQWEIWRIVAEAECNYSRI